MAVQVIPLRPVPNQTLQVQLGGQNCTLNIYQYAYGLFMTVYVGDTLIIAGVICENMNRIVRSLYLGFDGDLTFIDQQGTDDPIYTGFGDQSARFQLLYIPASDLPAGVG
jgi:hypothetical protein